jgi:tight adherence protein C
MDTFLPSIPESEATVPLLASVLVGTFAFGLVRCVVLALESDDLEQGDQWRYDVTRVNELRRLDWTYRVFQPLVQWLARLNRVAFRRFLPQVDHDLQAAGYTRFWLPEEYLARCEVLALFLCPVYLYLCVALMDLPGAILALALTGLTAWLLRRRLASQARYRIVLIKRRMPFFLDLLTLLMEAGSTFLQALRQAVDELQGHPVSTEFGRVLTDISMGKTRVQAFTALRQRLGDDEIGSIIGSIVQGEELGTPLARLFRTQSDVLRIKRTQRAERLAGEAGVNMLLPGILVMMSTVLIIFGPFILNYIYIGLAM